MLVQGSEGSSSHLAPTFQLTNVLWGGFCCQEKFELVMNLPTALWLLTNTRKFVSFATSFTPHFKWNLLSSVIPPKAITDVVLSQHFLRMAHFCIVKTLSEELLNLRTVFILQSRAVENNITTIFIARKLEKWLSTSFKPILNDLI